MLMTAKKINLSYTCYGSYGSTAILPTLPFQHCNLTLTPLAELLSNLVSFVKDCYLPMAPGQHCNFAVATRQHYNLAIAGTANLPWFLWNHCHLTLSPLVPLSCLGSFDSTAVLIWLLGQHFCLSQQSYHGWHCKLALLSLATLLCCFDSFGSTIILPRAH